MINIEKLIIKELRNKLTRFISFVKKKHIKLLKTNGIKIWIFFFNENMYKNKKCRRIKTIAKAVDSKIMNKIVIRLSQLNNKLYNIFKSN